jgi:hypothetical protein
MIKKLIIGIMLILIVRFSNGQACAGKDSSINISNLGVTGIERSNPEYTSVRTVILNLNYSTGASECRYINYDSGNPPEDHINWTNWEVCVNSRTWILSEGLGLKRVFYNVNYTGNCNLTSNDTIYYIYTGAGLDTSPP